MAKFHPSFISLALFLLVSRTFGLEDADLLGSEPRPAFRMVGGQFASNLTGISNPEQDIFGRQACGQGYGQCGRFSAKE
jgi:hypothetical protein